MSVERSQDEGERYGISEPHGYREGNMSYYEKLKLGSFCHIDDVSWQRRNKVTDRSTLERDSCDMRTMRIVSMAGPS
jgi:hypothetical protein